MYGPGQVVYDLDKKVPYEIGDDVWDVESYPKRHTHFIRHADPNVHVGRAPGGLFYEVMEIAIPSSTLSTLNVYS